MIFVYCLTGKMEFFKIKAALWHGLAALIAAVAIATPYVIPEISSQYPFIIEQSAGPLNKFLRIFTIVGLLYALYYSLVIYPVRLRRGTY